MIRFPKRTKPTIELKTKHSNVDLRTTVRVSLLFTLHRQQFGAFSPNVQRHAIRYPSRLCRLCFHASGQVWRSSRTGELSTDAPVCLLSWAWITEPSPLCFCCVSVRGCVSCILHVCAGVNDSERCQPYPEHLSLTPRQGCGTKRPLSQ